MGKGHPEYKPQENTMTIDSVNLHKNDEIKRYEEMVNELVNRIDHIYDSFTSSDHINFYTTHYVESDIPENYRSLNVLLQLLLGIRS